MEVLAAAEPAEHKLLVAEAGPAEVRRSEVAAGEKADRQEADNLDSRAAANSNRAVVEAGMVDVCLEVHAICNSHNLLPNTIRRHPGSKPTGSIDSSIVRQQPLSASF